MAPSVSFFTWRARLTCRIPLACHVRKPDEAYPTAYRACPTAYRACPIAYMPCPIAYMPCPIALHVMSDCLQGMSDCLQGMSHCSTCHVRLLTCHVRLLYTSCPIAYMPCPIALHVMSDCLHAMSDCSTCHVRLLYMPCPIALRVMSDCFTCHVRLLYVSCPIALRVMSDCFTCHVRKVDETYASPHERYARALLSYSIEDLSGAFQRSAREQPGSCVLTTTVFSFIIAPERLAALQADDTNSARGTNLMRFVYSRALGCNITRAACRVSNRGLFAFLARAIEGNSLWSQHT